MLYTLPHRPVSSSGSPPGRPPFPLSPCHLVPPSPFLVRDRPRSAYGDFSDDLRAFISSRLDRVDPYAESTEYRAQQEKASQLYERLHAMLSEDGQALLVQYAEAVGTAHYLEVEMLAERAFFDGVRMVVKSSHES